MNTRNESPSSAHLGGTHGDHATSDRPGADRAIGLYLAGCLALAVIAAVLLMTSCGARHDDSSRVVVDSGAPTAPAGEQAVPAVLESPAAQAEVASMQPVDGSREKVVPAGLPPEIAIGEIETVVAPGEPIAITVYGTPDVTEMSLWDGLNDRQAFVHDAQADVWRVDYRVPLRPRAERIGLSVTARNDFGRWRRVWVFLQVASATPAVDSSATATGER